MKKEIRDAIIRAETNEVQKSQFIQDLGQKAHVERGTIANEKTEQLRDVLKDIGRDLITVGAVPQGCDYIGSLSVHVYTIEALGSALFACLTVPGQMTSSLADGALRELNGSVKVMFGQARQTLRSGF